MFAVVIFVAAFFLPESPRWLYVNNKQDQSKAMLTKYHGEGNPDSEWVKLQLNEYEELLEMDGADKRWWDYRALFKNRSTRYRLMCNVSISIFGQWAGNGPFKLSHPVLISSSESYQPLTTLSRPLILHEQSPRYNRSR